MKKVLVIGATSKSAELLLQRMREEYGNEIELYTPEEAQEKGISSDEFVNIPTYKIEAMPKYTESITIKGDYATGGKVGKGGRARNRSKFRRG